MGCDWSIRIGVELNGSAYWSLASTLSLLYQRYEINELNASGVAVASEC